MRVLPDMRPRRIEDFRISRPDAFNGFADAGDSDADWSPAINRAMTAHLGLTIDGLQFQTNPLPTIEFGHTRDDYPVLRTVHMFANIVGIRTYVRLSFSGPLVEDCIVSHYPDTPDGLGGYNPGTFHPDYGYSLAPGMAPFEGYGTTSFARLENIEINCSGSLGSNVRGIVMHRRILASDCFIRSSPWHGAHIVGDVLEDNISNANGVVLRRIFGYNCGKRFGTLARLVDPDINLTGFRGYGWGAKIQGGDGNIIITEGCDYTACGRGGLHDFGFLGPDTHILIHSEQISEPFLRTQLEADLEASSSAWIAANPDPGTGSPGYDEWVRRNQIAQETLHACRGWGQAVGSINYWAVVLDGPSSRSVAISTYAESDGILQVDNNNIAVGGIVSRVLGTGMKMGVQASQINGTWRAQLNQGLFASVGFGLANNAPMFLSSPSGTNQRLEFRTGFYAGHGGRFSLVARRQRPCAGCHVRRHGKPVQRPYFGTGSPRIPAVHVCWRNTDRRASCRSCLCRADDRNP
ncbi:MAG: hypothetical protein HC882_01455 [Acidobacteria bacterium]|nr:hypothetical protein [Acidobacteriota bacterium]